jgi:hypothetical protein
VATAASNWTVGLSAGSSASAQAASITNLTITQVTPVPALTNQLYPAGNGDVKLTISNPNPFPVTITGLTTPATGAAGFSDAGLTTPVGGCNAASSTVTWQGTAGAHAVGTIVVAASGQANNPLTVTFSNAATMGASAPATCAGLFFSLPSLTGITATGGAATATTSPTTDTYS